MLLIVINNLSLLFNILDFYIKLVNLKMSNKLKKIGVLTSGGDAPGMNAAVRAVVRSAEFHNIHCYGIYKGFEGLISDEIKKLNARSVKNIVNSKIVFKNPLETLEE